MDLWFYLKDVARMRIAVKFDNSRSFYRWGWRGSQQFCCYQHREVMRWEKLPKGCYGPFRRIEKELSLPIWLTRFPFESVSVVEVIDNDV